MSSDLQSEEHDGDDDGDGDGGGQAQQLKESSGLLKSARLL